MKKKIRKLPKSGPPPSPVDPLKGLVDPLKAPVNPLKGPVDPLKGPGSDPLGLIIVDDLGSR